MGWKASFIIVAHEDCPAGYLGTLPTHDADRATELIKQLGYTYKVRKMSNMEPRPKEGSAVIGAYKMAAMIADQAIYKCFDNRDSSLFKQALQIYPNGSCLILVLHSVVNLYGYALYEKGVLIREFGGNGEEEITSEFGNPLPEEAQAFERSKIINGERVFYDEIGRKTEEFSPSSYGETLAFLVASRFFGECLDMPTRPDVDLPEDLGAEVIYF